MELDLPLTIDKAGSVEFWGHLGESVRVLRCESVDCFLGTFPERDSRQWFEPEKAC
jgi:hypothetical protein